MPVGIRQFVGLGIGLGLLLLASTASAEASKPSETKRINVNTAPSSELVALPGIGPKKAEAIVLYREANGRFATVDDMIQVKGIGAKTLEKLRPLVTVGKKAQEASKPKKTPKPKKDKRAKKPKKKTRAPARKP